MWRDANGRFLTNGKGVPGAKRYRTKAGLRGGVLTEEKISLIREEYKEGYTIAELAERHHVATGTIHRALVGGSNPIKMRPSGPVGSMDVPTSQIVELREVQGLTYAKIAQKVMLNPSTVRERYLIYRRKHPIGE